MHTRVPRSTRPPAPTRNPFVPNGDGTIRER
jgi:hypothetical protein